MEEPRINFGVWHPSLGIPPEISESLDFGAWYSLEAADVDGEYFEVGDWLVYIREGKDHWKKSKGIFSLDKNEDDDEDSQTTIPGEYTKVKIDANGNVIDGGYLLYEDLPSKFRKGLEEFRDSGLKNQVLEILKTIFLRPFDDDVQIKWEESTQTFNFTVNIDDRTIVRDQDGRLSSVGGEGGSSEGCANHKHSPDDITDLDKYILNIINNYSFIENVQNHLEDFVDGTTVIINQNGKISAVSMDVGPHTHKIDDIVDLEKPKVTVWASDQNLHNDLDFNEGALKLQNESVGGSIYHINNALKNIQKIAEDAAATAKGEIDPGPPGKLKEATFVPMGKTYTVYDVNTREKVECYKTLKIGTTDILYNDQKSIYEIYLDNEANLICRVDSAIITKEGKYKGFRVTYAGDAYPSIKTFQNKYKGFSFETDVDLPEISEGYHDIYIHEVLPSGEIICKKEITNIPIGVAVKNLAIVGAFPSTLQTRVSGVSRYSGDTQSFKIPLKVNCVNVCFAPESIFKIKNNIKENTEEVFDFQDVSIIGQTASLNYFIEVPKRDYRVLLKITSQDIFGQESLLPISSPYFHYDTTTVEADYRYARDLENEQYEQYRKFDSTAAITPDSQDCLFENDIAKITHFDYSELNIGPDYSNLPDIQSFVLRFDCSRYLSNFYLDIEKENGKTYTTDRYGQFNDIKILAAFSEADNPKNWIDCNKYWIKNSKYNPEEITTYGGLDLFRSDRKRRWVTLGPNNFMNVKYLYLKITLLKEDSTVNLKTLVNSIEECINER